MKSQKIEVDKIHAPFDGFVLLIWAMGIITLLIDMARNIAISTPSHFKSGLKDFLESIPQWLAILGYSITDLLILSGLLLGLKSAGMLVGICKCVIGLRIVQAIITMLGSLNLFHVDDLLNHFVLCVYLITVIFYILIRKYYQGTLNRAAKMAIINLIVLSLFVYISDRDMGNKLALAIQVIAFYKYVEAMAGLYVEEDV